MATTNDYLSIKPLFQKFISESEKGKRLQKNGSLLSQSSISNYKAVLLNITRFIEYSKKDWLFNVKYKHSKSNFEKEKRHYKNFYIKFTEFLYSKGCLDNYVGMQIKIIRTFFLYLINSKGYEMGMFYRDFYARKEEIPIIVISQEQLSFLISDKEFEAKLPETLKVVKDIFVVGCSIGLRYSDLIALRPLNLEKTNSNVYIINKSQKTDTYTRIKIPDYVLQILNKYKNRQKTLLPKLSLDNFNQKAKNMAEIAGWTYEVGKVRRTRGVKKEQKNIQGKEYRFCDMISSHVMRRTAITTMLILGMPESLVRKVSGHTASSKEFYKYVKYSESFMDDETDRIFEKLVKAHSQINHGAVNV